MTILGAGILGVSADRALGGESPGPDGVPASSRLILARAAPGNNLGNGCGRYYPLSSRMLGEEGTTAFLVLVDTDGRVAEVHTEIGSGYVALDEAASHCIVAEAHFLPQLVDGVPVSSWQRMRFTWRLEDPDRSDAAGRLIAAYRKGDFTRLLKLLRPYAEDGSTDAQVMLARMYLRGLGVDVNRQEAATWMRKAAERGSTGAQYEFGIYNEEGIGGPKDFVAAAAWFRKAAHERHPGAAFSLALLYQSGLGVERSSALALQWIESGIANLPASGNSTERPGYESVRASILAGMSPAQIDAAHRLASLEGPVSRGYLRNQAVIDKASLSLYPAHPGERNGRRTVSVLAFVHADGHVSDLQVDSSSGFPTLDAATLQLLARAEVYPKQVQGDAVDGWQIITWTWALR